MKIKLWAVWALLSACKKSGKKRLYQEFINCRGERRNKRERASKHFILKYHFICLKNKLVGYFNLFPV